MFVFQILLDFSMNYAETAERINLIFAMKATLHRATFVIELEQSIQKYMHFPQTLSDI